MCTLAQPPLREVRVPSPPSRVLQDALPARVDTARTQQGAVHAELVRGPERTGAKQCDVFWQRTVAWGRRSVSWLAVGHIPHCSRRACLQSRLFEALFVQQAELAAAQVQRGRARDCAAVPDLRELAALLVAVCVVRDVVDKLCDELGGLDRLGQRDDLTLCSSITRSGPQCTRQAGACLRA